MRAGRGMSRLTRRAAARQPEEAILAAPGRDTAATAAVLALTAVAFAVAADHGILAHIQRVDDAWLRLMVSGRVAPVTVIAKVFNLLGLMYVTLPVRGVQRPGRARAAIAGDGTHDGGRDRGGQRQAAIARRRCGPPGVRVVSSRSAEGTDAAAAAPCRQRAAISNTTEPATAPSSAPAAHTARLAVMVRR